MRILLKRFIAVYLLIFAGAVLFAQKSPSTPVFSKVSVQQVFKDTVSIRAIDVSEDEIFYAGSRGKFGHIKVRKDQKLKSGKILPRVYNFIANEVVEHKGKRQEFRSVASTKDAFFFLSVDNPALLYRYDREKPGYKLVYTEDGEGVFYDSMAFWNEKEGIAMGDPTDDCLSIVITRNGGKTWEKLSCNILPKTVEGEAAFAASNSNIAIHGDHVWIISGGKKSRVFHSADKGKSWKVYNTPIIQGMATTGAYSVDFYDDKNGFMIGGDYTDPQGNTANKAFTSDGGKTWKLIASGSGPGYKSRVTYVPGSGGRGLVAVGGDGISYSADGGATWKDLAKDNFHTIEFINKNTAYAAGEGTIARLEFE